MSKQIASKPQTIVADAERMLAELVAHCSMNACAISIRSNPARWR